MIHDGRYITMDKLGPQLGGGDAAWKAIIARPTAMEASYGATSTSVFYVDGTVPGYENELGGDESIEVAIRFVGSDGKFYFQQNATHLGPGSAGMGNVIVFERNGTLPCDHPYDPRSLYCADKVYDGEDPMAFTPACCGGGYCGDTAAYTEASLGSDNLGDCSSERQCDEVDEERNEAETVDDETESDNTDENSSDESDKGASTASSVGTTAFALVSLVSSILLY